MSRITHYNRLFYNESLEDAHFDMRKQRYKLDLAICDAETLISDEDPTHFQTSDDHARRAMERVQNELAEFERLQEDYEWMRAYAFSK